MAREPIHVLELRRALGRALTDRRQSTGWSQRTLAEALHYHRTAVSHLEAGRHPAPREFWEAADRLLAADGALLSHYDELVTAKGEEFPTRSPETDNDPVCSAPWNHGGTVEAAVVLKGGGDGVKRRAFLSLTGTALTAPAHQWLIHEPDPLVSALSGHRVSKALVDRLPGMIAELRAMDDVAGGGRVFALARHQFGWVAGLLDQASYDERTGRKLHTALAELGQLAAWFAYDRDEQGLAQRYYVAALRAAHTADDRPLGKHILACMAGQAAHTGQPAEAVTLVETALAGTRRGESPKLLAELHIRRAYALAVLRDARGCAAALAHARAQAGQISPDDGPPWLYWLGPASIAAETGDCLLRLGHADRAATMLDDGIARYDRSFTRDRQIHLTRLADALARPGRQRDLVAAAEQGMKAVALAEGLDSTRGISRLRNLHHQLQPHHKVPAVRDFLERARELVHS